MPIGPEVSSKIIVSLGQQEAFDKIIDIIERGTKFSIQSEDSPTKITAYGGRGPSKFWKATVGIGTLGIGTVASHYSSPKRIANIFIKNNNGTTKITIQTEGWTDGDSRISTFVNIITEELMKYEVDDIEIKQDTQSDDPIKILKMRYAKGEITKEEFDEMKKNLE